MCCGASNRQIGWGILAALAVANIALMVAGATGYLVLLAAGAVLRLATGAAPRDCHCRGLGAIASSPCSACARSVPEADHANLQEMRSESADRPASSSTGFRLEFYRNTLTLIQKQPLLGSAPADFPQPTPNWSKAPARHLSRNPHNEFMLVTIQIGLFGLAALLWLLWQQWRLRPCCPRPWNAASRRAGGDDGASSACSIPRCSTIPKGLLYAWLTALLYAGLKSVRDGNGARKNIACQLITMHRALSVIIIAKNSGTMIRRCLESVAWADEIIVVDSGSTDDTQDICRELGAKRHCHHATGPASARRKTARWMRHRRLGVLSSTPTNGSRRSCATKSRPPSTAPLQHPAYTLPRSSSFCGRFMRHSGWWPDYVMRLFRRGRARFSDDQVHERLIVDGAIHKLRQPLMHETVTDLDQLVDKMNLYSTASARDLHARGRRASIWTALLHGGWAFFRTYVLRAGFLDGREGLMLAIANAEGSYYRYVKLMLHGDPPR